MTPGTKRVQSIDILRGAVMIVMALDHTRDFIHLGAQSFSPEDLARSTPAIFFTRWITHFCAPVFMLTAGLSAFLWAQRRASTGQLSRFLLTRGIWLMILEVTVLRAALYFNFDYSFVMLLVIWGLGCCMVALAALVWLPFPALAVLSAGLILFHNLLDGIKAQQFGSAAWVWLMLHQLGTFKLGGHVVLVAYTLIPWVAVMAAGYCLGRVFLLESAQRQKFFIWLGLGLTLAFLLVRALNVYGDPRPWSPQRSAIFTLMSFLNCVKYPPSLSFLLMTLGPALMVMGLVENVRLSSKNPLLVFGRVPFFYYLLHMPLIHLLAMGLAWARYGHAGFFLNGSPAMGGPRKLFPPDYGWDLWVCYAVWMVTVALLYPVCRWFAALKERRRDWWLSYL